MVGVTSREPNDDFRLVNLIMAGFGIAGLLMSIAVSGSALTKFGLTHWQKSGELSKNGFFGKPGTGFFLGKMSKPKRKGKYLVAKTFPHALIVAPTGRGKTSGFVIPNLLTWEGSAVVLDVKGENFEATARHRHKQGDKIFRFAPTDFADRRTHRYNPLLRISELKDAALDALGQADPQPMLTSGTARAYADAVARTTKSAQRLTGEAQAPARCGLPALFEVTAAEWLANPALAEEMFGPAAILVRTASAEETVAVARSFEGQLTATLQMEPEDTDAARSLMPILERKAGRILANGFPTGVEVADAMVHGGPFPASTNFGATSVGSLGIRRFLRPVSFQNIPEELLPADLRQA